MTPAQNLSRVLERIVGVRPAFCAIPRVSVCDGNDKVLERVLGTNYAVGTGLGDPAGIGVNAHRNTSESDRLQYPASMNMGSGIVSGFVYAAISAVSGTTIARLLSNHMQIGSGNLCELDYKPASSTLMIQAGFSTSSVAINSDYSVGTLTDGRLRLYGFYWDGTINYNGGSKISVDGVGLDVNAGQSLTGAGTITPGTTAYAVGNLPYNTILTDRGAIGTFYAAGVFPGIKITEITFGRISQMLRTNLRLMQSQRTPIYTSMGSGSYTPIEVSA